ncbi:MAG: hypothetical protein ACK5JD_10625 [Mangrovibacterium sp.]
MQKNGNIRQMLLLGGLVLLLTVKAQAQQLWADVELSKTSVFMGEPVEVSISVYTETWFTSGVDLGNINVQGAFSAYFRPVSISVQRNGKNFPGVKLIYHVFPYSEKDVTFPALSIQVETPPVGGYKGEKRTVKTSAKTIRVKPIPPDFEKTGWLVASGLSVSENWSGDRNNVKVGDVLRRTITRKAEGTVAELIPPTVWDTVVNVSTYPGQNSIDNFKSKTAISSQRTESVQYLFEKEGTVVLPEKVYTWYNPVSKKLYKRTLPKVQLQVAPNPDLGMLASVRDSLQNEQVAVADSTDNDKPLTILGMSLQQFIVALVLLVTVFTLLFRLGKRLFSYLEKRRSDYLKSEAYFFRKLLEAIRKGNKEELVTRFYRWVDELRLDEPTLGGLNTATQKSTFHSDKNPNEVLIQLTKSQARQLREGYLKRSILKKSNTWITP